VVADCPGHEQYTRNMATGASTAELAVVLIDARKGVLQQTRRHAHIVSLLGIRQVVLAVNKIDLVGHDKSVFDTICADFAAFSKDLGFEDVVAIPISARFGDNVVDRSNKMPWYDGPSLLGHLDQVSPKRSRQDGPLRFPIQYVNRPNLDFRGFCGTIAQGSVTIGDTITVARSGQSTKVVGIINGFEDVERAKFGDSVTLVLEDEVELARGNMLVSPDDRPHVADQVAAHLVWFDQKPLIPGREYILRTECTQVVATVTTLKHRLDVNSLAKISVNSLEQNEIGVVNLSLQEEIPFDGYSDCPETGCFVIIDRMTNATAAAGMISFPLRRASNIHRQAMLVDKKARSEVKRQKSVVLWFTGLSGSGKSTIANLLEQRLTAEGRHTYSLDGDNVRYGLNRDLGFLEGDRVENVRRVAEVGKLMVDAGIITLVSLISPYKTDRDMARSLVEADEFIEVFVDTPFEECAARDPKGLYAKAIKGEIKNFTGYDAPYEAPENPELHLKTLGETAAELADAVENY
ncbi:MAG: adenylyl-sulfate kinase, partial [Pseudomonadota bacterium]